MGVGDLRAKAGRGRDRGEVFRFSGCDLRGRVPKLFWSGCLLGRFKENGVLWFHCLSLGGRAVEAWLAICFRAPLIFTGVVDVEGPWSMVLDVEGSSRILSILCFLGGAGSGFNQPETFSCVEVEGIIPRGVTWIIGFLYKSSLHLPAFLWLVRA